MLITTCSHCHARFRVTPQQLNTKQGQVRCGRCQNVFNGFEALERFPDDDTAPGCLPRARPPSEQRMPSAHRRSRSRSRSSRELRGASRHRDAPGTRRDGAHALPRTGACAGRSDATVRHSAPAARASAIHGHVAGDRRAQSRPRGPGLSAPPCSWSCSPRNSPMRTGVRSRNAIRCCVPTSSPCAGSIGCTVAWAREERLLKLEDSELLEVPGKPTEIALNARIRNMAAVAQEYPYVELTLTDVSGQGGDPPRAAPHRLPRAPGERERDHRPRRRALAPASPRDSPNQGDRIRVAALLSLSFAKVR